MTDTEARPEEEYDINDSWELLRENLLQILSPMFASESEVIHPSWFTNEQIEKGGALLIAHRGCYHEKGSQARQIDWVNPYGREALGRNRIFETEYLSAPFERQVKIGVSYGNRFISDTRSLSFWYNSGVSISITVVIGHSESGETAFTGPFVIISDCKGVRSIGLKGVDVLWDIGGYNQRVWDQLYETILPDLDLLMTVDPSVQDLLLRSIRRYRQESLKRYLETIEPSGLPA